MLKICEEKKLAGRGSIRWTVAKDDVDRKIAEIARLSNVVTKYLCGQRFDHCKVKP